MADFGKDVVVSLGKYFWSIKDKAVMKKGTKRTSECMVEHVPTLNQVIWNLDSHDIRKGDLNIVTSMGAFAGANFYSVSELNKDFQDKEEEL